MNNDQWYILNRPDEIDSPALLVYPERIRRNVSEMVRIAGGPERLIPHVKTHKMPAIVQLQLQAGIRRFKCATIAEAEMLATSGAMNILLAYQLNKSKALRFLQLTKQFPGIRFSSLADNLESAQMLNTLFAKNQQTTTVYIDIDNGMHRTGIAVEKDIPALYAAISSLSNVGCLGLHVYDGHIRLQNPAERKRQVEAAFLPVKKITQQIEATGLSSPEIIAGGSPTFPVHAMNTRVLCSPGTNILWDAGYARLLPDQHFLWAAVLLTRVISKPDRGVVTTDLGHKSVAAENAIDKRVFFLNLTNYECASQSEEHLVLKVEEQDWQRLKPGDALYGVPHHVCPTVALYDEVQVVTDGNVEKQWEVTARKKKITL